MTDGAALSFNLDALDSMTVEQIEWMEEVLNTSLLSVLPDEAHPDRPIGRVLRAFAYASMRAENPEFTIEDAGQIKVDMKDPPTTPRKRPAKKRG